MNDRALTRVDAVEGILTLANVAGNTLSGGTQKGCADTLNATANMLVKLGVTDEELENASRAMLSKLLFEEVRNGI